MSGNNRVKTNCKLGNGSHSGNLEAADRIKLSELEYLSDIIPQLRSIALGIEKKSLAYLLELAMTEAKLQLDAEIHGKSVLEQSDKEV